LSEGEPKNKANRSWHQHCVHELRGLWTVSLSSVGLTVSQVEKRPYFW